MHNAKSNNFKVLKLQETHPEECNRTTETATMFRLWSLLSPDAGVRDTTVGHRNIL